MKHTLREVGEMAIWALFAIVMWPINVLWHIFLALSFPIRFVLDTKE